MTASRSQSESKNSNCTPQISSGSRLGPAHTTPASSPSPYVRALLAARERALVQTLIALTRAAHGMTHGRSCCHPVSPLSLSPRLWAELSCVRSLSHKECTASCGSSRDVGPKVATFYFTEACGTSRDGRKLLARHRIYSQVPWYLAHKRDARLQSDTPLARCASLESRK